MSQTRTSVVRLLLCVSAVSTIACGAGAEPSAGANLPPPPGAEVDDKSICGSSAEWSDLEDGTAQQNEWGESVGNLRWDTGIGGSVDGARWCTATLISPNLMLTAGHCIDRGVALGGGWTLPAGVSSAQDFCDNMHVQFNFQEDGGVLPDAADMPTFACAEVVAKELTADRDHALIRLEGNPGEIFGYRELDIREPVDGEAVTVIQHPAGAPKKVHTGTVADITATTLGHNADTVGGSSGSPILDNQGRVIGVHTNGGCSDAGGFTNTSRRLDDIYDRVPELRITDYFDQNEEGDIEAGDQFGAATAVGDFDGDGFEDVVVGAPGENPGGAAANAGYVSIRYGSAVGPDATDTVGLRQAGGSNVEANDFFGRSLAVGDFDGDGFDDLVVGTPAEDWGSITNTGMVQIFEGRRGGIQHHATANRFYTAQSFGLTMAAYQNTGSAMAVGDFDNDGYDDLAIGIYGEANSAGAVGIVYGSPRGLSTKMLFDQADTGVGMAEARDLFGFALAAGDYDGDGFDDLAVSAPGETYGSGPQRAGHMTLVYGSAMGIDPEAADGFTQGTGAAGYNSFGFALASGDFNNDGRDDLAMGIPYDDSLAPNAGAVRVSYGTAVGIASASGQTLSHSTVGPGAAAYDMFGMELATGDLDGDGYDELLIGVPYDDDTAPNGGSVDVVQGGAWGLFGGETLTAAPLMASNTNDVFGMVLATGDVDGDGDDDVVAGLPSVDALSETSSGAVVVLDVE